MPPDVSAPVPVARTRRAKVAREYALVLAAVGIDCDILQAQGEAVIAVAPADAPRAARELDLYEQENRGWRRPEELPLALGESWPAVAAWFALLMVTHICALERAFGGNWWERGRVIAGAVREGELWRCVTALGLHADAVHLLGNLFFGALFVALVAEVLGSGLGLATVLVAGALANLANSWMHGPDFSSVGASTAVFAALGLLGGHRWQQRKLVRRLRRTSWIPLLAAAFLLAYLGSGGGHGTSPSESEQRIDVAGHALGFAVGLAIGVLHARMRPSAQRGRGAQLAFGAAAFALWSAAWFFALR